QPSDFPIGPLAVLGVLQELRDNMLLVAVGRAKTMCAVVLTCEEEGVSLIPGADLALDFGVVSAVELLRRQTVEPPAEHQTVRSLEHDKGGEDIAAEHGEAVVLDRLLGHR